MDTGYSGYNCFTLQIFCCSALFANIDTANLLSWDTLVLQIKGSNMGRVSISILCSSSMKTHLKIIYLVILTADVHLHPLSPSSMSSPCLLFFFFFNFLVASRDCQKITFCLLGNFDLLILLLGTIKNRSNFKDTLFSMLSSPLASDHSVSLHQIVRCLLPQ